MSPFHIVLLILALLLCLAAAFASTSTQPINRYGLPLLCLGLAIGFFDLLLIALRVYA